jgi:Ulp1 family protease
LKKIEINKQTLIAPINNHNHWFFCVWKKLKHIIHIYDSWIGPICIYKILNEKFDAEAKIIVEKFPQQTNLIDGGVYMLIGIEDYLRQ